MKKFCLWMVSLLVAFSIVLPMDVQAADKPVSVYINNKPVKLDVAPVIENGRTLVPMRAIFEEFQITVEWDAPTRTVTAMTEYLMCLELQIGNSTATKYFLDYSNYDFENQTGTIGKDNIQKIPLDAPAKIIGGRTMVPLRFIAESMDYEVKWDGTARRVDISTSPGEYIDSSIGSQPDTGFQSDNELSMETVYKRECTANSFDARDAAVNPSRNIGKKVTSRGIIIQIDGNIALLNTDIVSGSGKGYVSVQMPSGVSGHYIDDICTVYGELNGTKVYTMYNYLGLPVDTVAPFMTAKYADGPWNKDEFVSDKGDYAAELEGLYGTWNGILQARNSTIEITRTMIPNLSVYDGNEPYKILSTEKRREPSGDYLFIVLELTDYLRHFEDTEKYEFYKDAQFTQVIKYYYLQEKILIYGVGIFYIKDSGEYLSYVK